MKDQDKDEFYIGYVDEVPRGIKTMTKRFVLLGFLVLILFALVFALTQNQFKNSTFELTDTTTISGVYHESPYPMLRVQTSDATYKNILLLGFGKIGAGPFLEEIKTKTTTLSGSMLSIEGNLIYYNGKTLLQIIDGAAVSLVREGNGKDVPREKTLAKAKQFKGEIIDPKCYFGVMKPGKGKIHRSCAVLCIAGGIPPVLATADANNISEYYLITDLNGAPIHKEILPFIGKPSIIQGEVVQVEDWYQLRIDPKTIHDLDIPSVIYTQ